MWTASTKKTKEARAWTGESLSKSITLPAPPNSALTSLLSANTNGDEPKRRSTGLEEALLARQPGRARPQAPAHESEADGLSAGVRAKAPDALKQEMGGRLGADFSGVRFHTDGTAKEHAAAMGARAFTSGGDVYFGEGGFEAGVAAHELVHTAQQGAVQSAAPVAVAAFGGIQMQPSKADIKKGAFNRQKDAYLKQKDAYLQQKDANLQQEQPSADQAAQMEEAVSQLAKQLMSMQEILAGVNDNSGFDDMRAFIMEELFDFDTTGANADPGRMQEFTQYWGNQFVTLGQTKAGESLLTQIYERRYGQNEKKITIGESTGPHATAEHNAHSEGLAESVPDAQKNFLRAGTGDNSRVYLQDLTMAKLLSENTEGPQRNQPLVSAAHELTHGLHHITGMMMPDVLLKGQGVYKRTGGDPSISMEEFSTTMVGRRPTEENEDYFTNMYMNPDDPSAVKKARRIFSVNEQRYREQLGMPKADAYLVRHFDPSAEDNPQEPYISQAEYDEYEKQNNLLELPTRSRILDFGEWQFDKRSANMERVGDYLEIFTPLKMRYAQLSAAGKMSIKQIIDAEDDISAETLNAYKAFLDSQQDASKEFTVPKEKGLFGRLWDAVKSVWS